MYNEILWFIMLFTTLGLVVLIYRFCGLIGLYVWISIASILANIQVLKTIDLLGQSATLGNILYASSFLVTDIMNEIYGEKTARYAVFFGFLSLICATLFMNFAIAFTPNIQDVIQSHFEALFSFLPSLVFASLLAFGISQLHDIWSYNMWKRLWPDPNYLWLRNNLSTALSQLLDSFIFVFIVTVLGVFPWEIFLNLFLSTYVIKLIVALFDTPFLYIAVFLKRRGWVQELPGFTTSVLLPPPKSSRRR